jgi:hypothetical protein
MKGRLARQNKNLRLMEAVANVQPPYFHSFQDSER